VHRDTSFVSSAALPSSPSVLGTALCHMFGDHVPIISPHSFMMNGYGCAAVSFRVSPCFRCLCCCCPLPRCHILRPALLVHAHRLPPRPKSYRSIFFFVSCSSTPSFAHRLQPSHTTTVFTLFKELAPPKSLPITSSMSTSAGCCCTVPRLSVVWLFCSASSSASVILQ
jgi:hypothetical protein